MNSSSSSLKVFVAGGTGVVGWRSVVRLVQAGHSVSVLARSEAKADQVRSMGATPVAVSLFDPAALVAAVAGHDVVMNLATHIPPMSKAASPAAWEENNRIRTEGSRNLVDAALAAGASRYVQESIAFLYADGGDRWLDEDAPIVDPMPDLAADVFNAEAQTARFTESGGVGVVLRFGFFHAPDSHLTVQALQASRLGRAAVLGPAGAYYPIIHAEDAADAVLAALRAPAGIYNIVDDEPLTKQGYCDAMAAALGDTRRLRLPPTAASNYAVKKQGAHLVSSQRVSNRRFKAATGWAPEHPTARSTLKALADALREPRRVRSLTASVLLFLLAAGSVFVGLWAEVAPQSFYDAFPGFGRVWVSVDGAFNEHLIRDVGVLNLALAVVAVVAGVTMLTPMVRAVAVAYLVYGVPHLLYHAGHLQHFAAADQVGMVVSLGSTVVMAAVVLALALRGPKAAPSPVAGASVAPVRSGSLSPSVG